MEKVRRCSSATVASSGSMVFRAFSTELQWTSNAPFRCTRARALARLHKISKLSMLRALDGPGLLQLKRGGAVPAVRMRCVGSRLRVPAAPVEE